MTSRRFRALSSGVTVSAAKVTSVEGIFSDTKRRNTAWTRVGERVKRLSRGKGEFQENEDGGFIRFPAMFPTLFCFSLPYKFFSIVQ